jgi:hypothetical protein
VLEAWLQDGEVQRFLQVNRYQDVLWFNKESLDQLLGWMFIVTATAISAGPARPASKVARGIAACYDVIVQLQRAAEKSGYQLDKLLEAVQPTN